MNNEDFDPPNSPLSISKTPTRIRGLDEILKGGLPVGRTTMFSGGPGSGKSVLAMEFLYRGAILGEPGVFISFEEQAEDFKANMSSMGMDIARLEKSGKLKTVHVEVPHGAIRAGQFDIKGLLAIINGNANVIGANRVVLDAMDLLMRIFGDAEREQAEMYIFNDWIRSHGLTTILTVKTNPDGRTMYPFLDFMVDCILFLDQRMEGQVRTRRLNVVKYRGSNFLSNEYPYVITSDGVVMMPISSVELTHRNMGERVSSGNEKLNEILGGGYFRGSSILISGASGTGKTSLASIFTQQACRNGEKVLYVSFEESEKSLVAGMRSIGLDLQRFLADETLNILTAMPESAIVEYHLVRIFNTMDEFSPQHLIVDAISACKRMGSERAATDFLIRLHGACKERGITCIYTNQISKFENVEEFSGIGISSLIDTLLFLLYHDDGRKLSRRFLAVKSRGTLHSMHYHELRISSSGLDFAPAVQDG